MRILRIDDMPARFIPQMFRSLLPSLPARVIAAVILASVAWLISATALAIDHLTFLGSGAGPGASLGIISLALQAAAIGLVVRRSVIGRTLVLVFFLISVLPLGMLPRLLADGSAWSTAQTVLGFVLKGAATALLFTGQSRQWFKPAFTPSE